MSTQPPGRANLAAIAGTVWACLLDVFIFWQLVRPRTRRFPRC